ncbi:MAG: serine/threonine protein kinase, partial [Planctomycetes bacterium]|nr:serine/threonine protein kinase [Planctomycetota bacterium]
MAHAQSPNEQISGGHGGISPYLLWYGCLARSNQRLWAARPEIRTTEMASNDDASLAANHSDWPETAQHAPTPHTQQIGPYKTLEVLGEGGMGVVYRAQQTKPVKREVALKLIKLGMDTKQVIARFESERQALALMDHPNVAKVFDAGATEQGRPYFVMELIHGLPITEHCDRHKLSIDQRLDLFMKACEAIQHAHQKGIIHRDIKPGNILVEYRDGQATPKIIDFGVAKATSQRLTEKTLFTEQGQMIGTPAYMSPEQADLSSQDIDTRSDIYSLGVLLYELLTGTLPFDAKSLRSAGFGEIQRIIRDEEPPKPSTRMTTGGFVSSDQKDAKDSSSLEAAANKRRSDPHTLMKRIRGDLDWIVLKCLEKDRSRRYASAADFAADLRRHLKNEPVQAGSPSATYRLIKFLRRNKGRIGMVGAVSIALLLAALGFVQADRARERAVSGDVQAYLLWLDENPLTHPSVYGNKHTLEAIVDRIRSGEASAFDYQALVKTVFKFEFAGRGGFIDARDASMVKGTGTLRHLSIAPNGLGLLVSPRVLLDGQPFPEAP